MSKEIKISLTDKDGKPYPETHGSSNTTIRRFTATMPRTESDFEIIEHRGAEAIIKINNPGTYRIPVVCTHCVKKKIVNEGQDDERS